MFKDLVDIAKTGLNPRWYRLYKNRYNELFSVFSREDLPDDDLTELADYGQEAEAIICHLSSGFVPCSTVSCRCVHRMTADEAQPLLELPLVTLQALDKLYLGRFAESVDKFDLVQSISGHDLRPLEERDEVCKYCRNPFVTLEHLAGVHAEDYNHEEEVEKQKTELLLLG